MENLKSTMMIYLKGLLFLLAGIISSIIILIELPTLKIALLLILAFWCFARAYFFAFYVIEHYVDATYKFSGLLSFFRYFLTKNK